MTCPDITPALVDSAFSYTLYRAHIDELMAMGRTTGPNQSPEMVAYAKLNIARMKRLEKTFSLPQNMWHQLQRMPDGLLFLTITEGWCGDAAQIVPVIDRMVSAKAGWQHKLILRDQHLEVMDHFLTNGKSRSIPVTIVLKADSLSVIGWWGPRPAGAQQLIDELKAAHIDGAVIKEKLHAWYGKDNGMSTATEFITALQQAFAMAEKKESHLAA
jgi:hypothetical protein